MTAAEAWLATVSTGATGGAAAPAAGRKGSAEDGWSFVGVAEIAGIVAGEPVPGFVPASMRSALGGAAETAMPGDATRIVSSAGTEGALPAGVAWARGTEGPCSTMPKVERIRAASTRGSTGTLGCGSVDAGSGEFVTGAVAFAESADGSPDNGSAVGVEALDDTVVAAAAQGVCGAPGCGPGMEAAAVPAGGQASRESPGTAAEEVDPSSGEGATVSPATSADVGDAKNCGWPPEAGRVAENPVSCAFGAAAATGTRGVGTAPDGAVWPVTSPGF